MNTPIVITKMAGLPAKYIPGKHRANAKIVDGVVEGIETSVMGSHTPLGEVVMEAFNRIRTPADKYVLSPAGRIAGKAIKAVKDEYDAFGGKAYRSFRDVSRNIESGIKHHDARRNNDYLDSVIKNFTSRRENLTEGQREVMDSMLDHLKDTKNVDEVYARGLKQIKTHINAGMNPAYAAILAIKQGHQVPPNVLYGLKRVIEETRDVAEHVEKRKPYLYAGAAAAALSLPVSSYVKYEKDKKRSGIDDPTQPGYFGMNRGLALAHRDVEQSIKNKITNKNLAKNHAKALGVDAIGLVPSLIIARQVGIKPKDLMRNKSFLALSGIWHALNYNKYKRYSLFADMTDEGWNSVGVSKHSPNYYTFSESAKSKYL